MSAVASKIRSFCGPLFPLATFFLVMLALLSVFRVSLLIWQWDRVAAVKGVWPILGYGLRMDVLFLCMLLALPVLLTLLLPLITGKTWWQALTGAWLTCCAIFLVFMEVATPPFISEYDTRPNRIFIEYLDHPREVFSTLWAEHSLSLFAGGISVIATVWIIGRMLRHLFSRSQGWSLLRTLIALPVVCALVFIGARSSFDHRPANPSTAAFSDDHMVNQLGLSSGYSLAFAIYNLFKDADSKTFYGKMPEAEILQRVRSATGLPETAFTDPDVPTLHLQKIPSVKDRPLNLVIILEESMGAGYSAALGGLPLTPELDRLSAEGLWLTRLYSTGTRSIRGIEAVVTGFTPTPAPSVVKLGLSQQNFFTLAGLLGQQGYRTSFIYGGDSEFDNMRGFFLSNGFDKVVDEEDFETSLFHGSWGVSDQDVFRRAHEEFLAQGEEPFFTLLFTTSNHSPFEFPEGDFELYNQPRNTRENAVRYADHALGEFFRVARQSPYWDRTLFLVVADHDSRVKGDALVPVKRFQIPGLIIGPGVSPGKYERVASQIDLAPTLLRLMGLETEHPMIGRDLLSLSPDEQGRAIMQYGNNHGYMRGDQVVIHRPGQPPVQFRYVDSRLEPVAADPELVRDALAHALWPSMTYRERDYRLAADGQIPAPKIAGPRGAE